MQTKIYLSPSMVSDFIKVTSKCDFDIDIASYNKFFVDAKSIVGVLGLDMTHALTICYNGYNEGLESFIAAHRVAC